LPNLFTGGIHPNEGSKVEQAFNVGKRGSQLNIGKGAEESSRPTISAGGSSHDARKTALAFAAVYVFWGSTFLAVRYAVETIPPLLAVGLRQIIAGMVLYPLARLHTKEKTTAGQWLAGALIGGLLIGGGNGSIAWAEAMRTPTNVVAVLVATVPLWMAIMDWLRPGGTRPTGRIMIALAVGLAGVGLLVSPRDPLLHTGSSAVTPICAVVLFFGSICWAAGSVFSRHMNLPRSPLLGTSIFAFTGGVIVTIAGLARGEGRMLDLHHISLHSGLATVYLTVFGSIIGFSAYTYLLGAAPAARVATYAYINPVVAVFLGWGLGGEALTSRMLTAAAIILLAVVLVITAPHPPEESSGQPVVPD
jgi:drug/metabolite transporter (DMT)-like permease